MADRSNRIATLFESSDARRAFAWVLAVAVAITLLKGLRLPNLYSATHFVFNYSLGFVRRGLVGEVMQRVFGERAFTYDLFMGFAFALFGLALAALVICTRRALATAPSDPAFRCALLVFVCSPALVFFVHMVGYLDYIGLLAVLCVVAWAPRSRSKYALFYVVACAAALFAFIHEILAVMFMPVFCFVMLCHMQRHWVEQTPLQRGSMFLHASVVVLFAFVLSGVVSTLGTRDPATINQLQATLAAKTDFGLRRDAFDALSRSSADNVSWLMPNYWKHSPWARVAPVSWLAALPGVLFLLRYGVALVRDVPAAGWARWLLGVSMLATVVAPQTLNLVGWDWNRWNAISLLGLFCCILAARLYFPSASLPTTGASSPRTASTSMLTAGVIALMLSLAADTPLFDQFKVQFFPFDEQLRFIRKLFNPAFNYRPVF